MGRIAPVAWAMALSGLAVVPHAADPRPTVRPGATKDDVINAYGWPNGQSQSGTKEILTYPQGLVTLETRPRREGGFSDKRPLAGAAAAARRGFADLGETAGTARGLLGHPP